MAKMIPDYINQEDPRRGGERLVFQWFSDNKIPGVVFYSLLQKNHKHKMIGEVDFLYVSQKGVLCIEVKGGKSIYCRNKQWYSLNKKNKENKIHNPFIQAKDCMYALKNYLADVYGKKSIQANYLIGYAVVFPECKFAGLGNDLVTEVMFDARFNLEDFPRFLDQTFNYWSEQEYKRHRVNHDKLTQVQVNQLIDLLRGDFCVVPSMHLELQHVYQQMLQLTEEQFDALDITDENSKVIIQGVAGTGKSLLALEKARKMIAKNKKILYVCFNKNMAKYAKQTLDETATRFEGSYVGTYHSLIQKNLNDPNLFLKNIEDVSSIFLSNVGEVEKYDYLIVDEAQDLMFSSVMEVLDKFLHGGMKNGKWALFLDPNQNIFNNTDEYDFTWQYLREVYSPVIFPLTRNCRNTEQIGIKTSILTLVNSAKHMKISGPKVVIKSYSDNKGLKKLLRTELTSLFSGGTVSSDVVILSKYKLSNSGIGDQASMCGMEINEIEDITKFRKHGLNYFTIQSFKGLESKVVFLIDVDGFENVRDRMLNYVAMSRAKILLYIFYLENSKDEYLNITCKGQDLLCCDAN